MQKVFEYIEEYDMIKAGDRVVVGVSGGADSICLLLLLLEYQKKKDFEIKVVHIEHGIRGQDSLSDAAFVEKFCKQRGVAFECFHFDIPALAKTLKITQEEAGRNCRYRAFEEVCNCWKGNKIAVAHNQNDFAETMLFHMARGSGIRGLAGIRPVRGKIIRPLLVCDRTEIEGYLRKKQISWCEDVTNQGEDYTRNIIRNRILPDMKKNLNQETIRHLAVLGEEARQAEEYLERVTEKICSCCMTKREGEVRIHIPILCKEDTFIQERVIRRSIMEAGCGLKDITREHIRLIMKFMDAQSGKCMDLPGEWIVVREFESLCIRRKQERTEFGEYELVIGGETRVPGGRFYTRVFSYENQQIPQNTYTKWLNYDKMQCTVVVRSRQSGDYLTMDSQGKKKKLKSYLTEIKIPVSEKDYIPLICSGKEVLWVVGYRISESIKVDTDTRQVLEIRFKED